jgi:hypothetical protein
MLCIGCGAEMRLLQVVPDNTMMVPGYEHRTWQCSGCNEVERRLVFTREKTPIEKIAPATAETPTDTAAVPNAWARAVAKLRGRHPS